MTTVKARSRPETFTITELADRAKGGGLRVPEFQRSFRWEQQDVINLFDSIWRGYPVGNVLLWKKEAPEAVVRIGDLEVEAPQMHGALWVVDGQQRITTLVNAVDQNVDEGSKFFVVYLPKSDLPARAMREASWPFPFPRFSVFLLFSRGSRRTLTVKNTPNSCRGLQALYAISSFPPAFSRPTKRSFNASSIA